MQDWCIRTCKRFVEHISAGAQQSSPGPATSSHAQTNMISVVLDVLSEGGRHDRWMWVLLRLHWLWLRLLQLVWVVN